jgi:hypothetical protein
MSSPIEARDAAARLVGRVTAGVVMASLAATGAIVGLLAPPAAPAGPEPASATGPVAQPVPVPRPRRTVVVPHPVATRQAPAAKAAKPSAPPVARVVRPRRAVVHPAARPPQRTTAAPVATSGTS